jgi:hypothetical protein
VEGLCYKAPGSRAPAVPTGDGGEETMKQVGLIDLPRWSHWPTRLLGLTPWTAPVRTVQQVDKEYDKEKYARLLDHYQAADGHVSPEEIEQFNYGRDLEDSTCVSFGNDLFEIPLRQAREHYYKLLRETLRPFVDRGRTLVELGTGYGFNLWMLKQHLAFDAFWGGDYSANAVCLASYLYRDEPALKVWQFNYYDPRTYEFLDQATAPVVLFTSHSVEQLPTAAPLLDCLESYRERICAVLHFEPVAELYDNTLLGQLRTRYTQLCHYNSDLLGQLRQRPAIRVGEVQPCVFGLNVLNPTSIVSWKFA